MVCNTPKGDSEGVSYLLIQLVHVFIVLHRRINSWDYCSAKEN